MPENKETITLELGVPELTVEPTTEIVEIPEQKDITAHYLENTKLTEAEQKMVDDFSEKSTLTIQALFSSTEAPRRRKSRIFPITPSKVSAQKTLAKLAI